MTTKQKQCLLAYLGYYHGAIDGSIGPQTRAAVLEFQMAEGLTADGSPGPDGCAGLSGGCTMATIF